MAVSYLDEIRNYADACMSRTDNIFILDPWCNSLLSSMATFYSFGHIFPTKSTSKHCSDL